jgi:hypothetical protein
MYKIFCLDEHFNDVTDVSFSFSEEIVSEYIKKIDITFVNNGKTAKLIPVVEQKTEAELLTYMMPCVLYNGNEFGSDNSPKHMRYEGEPWIFSADRTGIPGCTYIETADKGYALFAGTDTDSKNCSCSIYDEGGNIVQRIYFAHIETPKAFLETHLFGDAIIDIPEIKSGEEKHYVFYVYEYEKHQGEDFYGYKKLFDFANGDYCPDPEERFSVEQVKEWTWEVVRALVERTDFGTLTNIGFLPNGTDYLGKGPAPFIWRKGGKYEAGWCGQNLMIAELHLRSFIETNNSEDKETAMSILDTWLLRQHKSGLISSHYDGAFTENEHIDACNEGTIISELLFCSALLRQIGEDPSRYETAAEKICLFYLNNFSDGDFPQVIKGSGEAVVQTGGAGAFITLGFVHAYEYFGKKEYLDIAERSFAFYYDTYLKYSVCGGGALDTFCVDKEGAHPMLRAALGMYKLTDKKEYLDLAENIAHYMMTWCFYYNVDYSKDTDCGKLDIYTTGGTSVSASHHHLDCWGAYYVPEIIELAHMTGNAAYVKHAKILWRYTTQYISDGKLELHGMVRPRGMQNEAIFHCHWGSGDPSIKGVINDWMVAWPKAFQLKTIYLLGKYVDLI